MAELPYMTLFTQRLLGSRRVQALRDGDEWWYLGLLVTEWGFQGKGLPSDIPTLARLLRLPVETFREAWEGGIAQFFEPRNGRLFNDTLESLYAEAMRRKMVLVKAGKKGNRKRWGKSSNASPGDRSAIARADGDGDGDGDVFDGEKGQAGAADSEAAEVFDWLAFSGPCHLGRPRAEEVIRRHHPTLAACRAWEAKLKAGMPLRKLVWAVQQFGDPAELEAHEGRLEAESKNDPSLKATAEDREADVMQKRGRDALREARQAESEAVPAPADFMETYRKLKGEPPPEPETHRAETGETMAGESEGGA